MNRLTVEREAIDLFTKARIRLRRIGATAYFAAGAMALRKTLDWSCQTLWTDGYRMGLNPEYIAKQSLKDLCFKIAHEVMHVDGGHHLRRGSRDPKLWNVAGDYAINSILKKVFGFVPEGGLYEEEFEGMATEDIYRILEQRSEEQQQTPQQQMMMAGESEEDGSGDESPQESQEGPQDDSEGDDGDEDPSEDSGGSGGDSEEDDDGDEDGSGSGGDGEGDEDGDEDGTGGSGHGPGEGYDYGGCGEVRDAKDEDGEPLDENQAKEEEGKWRDMMRTSAHYAEGRDSMDEGLKRWVDDIVEPTEDPEALLREFVHTRASDDYSYDRRNRDYQGDDDPYMPALYNERIDDVVFCVDTSASMEDESFNRASGWVKAICEDLGARLHVIYCDTRIRGTETFEPDFPIEFQPVGGGGTDFRPAFKWIEREMADEDISVVLYFTDLLISRSGFPATNPNIPTMWLQYGGLPPRPGCPPFGQVVKV